MKRTASLSVIGGLLLALILMVSCEDDTNPLGGSYSISYTYDGIAYRLIAGIDEADGVPVIVTSGSPEQVILGTSQSFSMEAGSVEVGEVGLIINNVTGTTGTSTCYISYFEGENEYIARGLTVTIASFDTAVGGSVVGTLSDCTLNDKAFTDCSFIVKNRTDLDIGK